MINRSEFYRFLEDTQDELDARDDGNWPLPEFAPEILAWLEQRGVIVDRSEPCEYTFAHTRHWCKNPGCRES